MPKSTKILLITLVIFTIVGVILATLNSEGLIAAPNTPSPQNKPQAQTSGSNEPKEYKKTEKCDGNNVDSGAKIWVECKNADQINAAPLNGDTYSLSMQFKFTWTGTCRELIKNPVVAWNLGETGEPLPGIDKTILWSESGDYSGTLTHQFKLNENYAYKILLPVYRTSYAAVDISQGILESNTCRMKRTNNPDETIGEDIVSSDDKEVTGGGTGANFEKCKEDCIARQECRRLDPICKGFCSFNCFMLDALAGFFNSVFKMLMGAVGIS